MSELKGEKKISLTPDTGALWAYFDQELELSK